MKKRTLKPLIIVLMGLFAIEAFGVPVVHYSRVKKKCGIFGCSSTSKTEDVRTMPDGSLGAYIDIECYGRGFELCPHVVAPEEDPTEYDNLPEMQYIIGYIEDEVGNGNESDTLYMNVANEDGSVWSYLVGWVVGEGEGDVDDETYIIERITEVVE